MAFDAATLPKVALSRAQWLRLIFVGIFVLLAVGRVLPDAVRVIYPLHYFDYVTNGDAIVVRTDAKPPKGDDRISLGDRVRIDRIKPFDRKPGLAGASYSYDNPERALPVEHHGRVRTLQTYAARPVQRLDDLYGRLSDVIIGATIAVFIFSFVRSHAEDRRRIGWMIVAFAFAGAARLASDTFYPAHIGPWENGMLLALTPLPIVAVWVAVLRHRFFNVDFVVSRAVVYVAITAGIIGAVTLIEELGTYNFYMNTDFAYGFLIVFSMAVGAATNRIRPYVEHVVDRFIFSNRHSQREALEIIGGYILDAEHVEDVYRALLEDATHALGLSFAGILTRHDDGSFRLEQNYAWPADCVVTLDRGDELIAHISRSRGALTFSGKESRLIRKAFPNERLTFAAPLFFDRSVSAIVVYGHSVSGLDLDPEERDQLVRVVAHASIALHQIELARYRAAAAQNVVPLGAR